MAGSVGTRAAQGAGRIRGLGGSAGSTARDISARTGASLSESAQLVSRAGGRAARDFARGVERSAKHVTRNPNQMSGRQKMVAAGVLGAGGYGAGREATDAYEHRQQRQSIAENADLVREISERDDLTPEQKTRMYEQMVESGGLDHDPTSGSEGESRLGGLMPTFVGFNMETFFLIVLLYFGTKVVAGGS